jgi:hypothetical protein
VLGRLAAIKALAPIQISATGEIVTSKRVQRFQKNQFGKIAMRLEAHSLKFQYNDGGRKAAGYQGKTGDCVCRSIAIATKMPYAYVYMLLNEQAQQQRITKRQPKRGSARTGIYKTTIRQMMEMLGWKWTPTMQIGSGCKVHLRDGELPMGMLVVSVSKHRELYT